MVAGGVRFSWLLLSSTWMGVAYSGRIASTLGLKGLIGTGSSIMLGVGGTRLWPEVWKGVARELRLVSGTITRDAGVLGGAELGPAPSF